MLATRILKVSTGRERPYVRPCSVDPDYVSDCDSGRDDSTSFCSGHTSSSATLVALLCTRHLKRAERSA